MQTSVYLWNMIRTPEQASRELVEESRIRYAGMLTFVWPMLLNMTLLR